MEVPNLARPSSTAIQRASVVHAFATPNSCRAAAETRGNRRELKPGNYYQGCIFAWNAYREAKAISSIKFDARKGLHKITE